ncbi:UvrD-helicase domain-containing protein [Embleya sp. NPDC008237]|uniref:UvrD-helicase domain-containing protein n=1 Tax=Embleya sp. NPDC008237 TaxID=3363978 RepID=UPI0036E5031D
MRRRTRERELRERAALARREARRSAGSEGERRVVAQLLVLTGQGWRLLIDRRWPGAESSPAGLLAVGSGGVFVIHVEDEPAAPELVDGCLRVDGRSREHVVDALLAATRSTESAVQELGLAPIAVEPLIVFAGHPVDRRLGRVRLLGEREVAPALAGATHKLRAATVRAVAEHLGRAFPHHRPWAIPPPDRREAGQVREVAEEPALFDGEALLAATLDAERRGPIEQWMTVLHPDQVGLVRRNWAGPARISGPAGTGKTVVGLHRAAHLAQRGTGRILYVTFANNLPRVQGTLFRVMAPRVAERVDFRSLHAWARELLAERGVRVRLDSGTADTAFGLAWLRSRREGRLPELSPSPKYWQDEIEYVIKGRGITDFAQYAALPRRGRKTLLRRSDREAVWALYELYEQFRIERDVHDFGDVLRMALEEVRREPGRTSYTSVIVDEVQDLTLVGVQLLHALVGDAPNGLLLIGDGQQAVYPGGFRLADAGIDIRGDRGQVLRVNYRNRERVLRTALAVVADDDFEDFDGDRLSGRRDVELTYHDGETFEGTWPTGAEHDGALVAALRALADAGAIGDAAVLCPSRKDIEHYRRLLTKARLPVLALESYHGVEANAIKLGSYRRAKGLEFKHVFLPRYDAAVRTAGAPGFVDASEAVLAEHHELARRQLFVAISRARESVWKGRIG